jgi:hypothetical protein
LTSISLQTVGGECNLPYDSISLRARAESSAGPAIERRFTIQLGESQGPLTEFMRELGFSSLLRLEPTDRTPPSHPYWTVYFQEKRTDPRETFQIACPNECVALSIVLDWMNESGWTFKGVTSREEPQSASQPRRTPPVKYVEAVFAPKARRGGKASLPVPLLLLHQSGRLLTDGEARQAETLGYIAAKELIRAIDVY